MQSEIYEQSIDAIRRGDQQNLKTLLETQTYLAVELTEMLHLAIKLHQTPIVKMLVNPPQPTNTNAKNKPSNTKPQAPNVKPQTYHVDPTALVKYIVEEEDGIKKQYGYNAFSAAAFYGHIDILKLLVESVGSVDKKLMRCSIITHMERLLKKA
jgi:hypothetical protein